MFKIRCHEKSNKYKNGKHRKKIKSTTDNKVQQNDKAELHVLSESSTSTSGNKENNNDERFQEIAFMCKEVGIKFEDEEFPTANSSLFRAPENDTGASCHNYIGKSIATWERPENIRMKGQKGKESDWVLIKDPCPSDICQGRLGNCWFVAALTLIAERSELIDCVLPCDQINSFGVYSVRLFMDGNWKNVIVDDRLPCDSFKRLVFSSVMQNNIFTMQCRRNQLWVPLIEKAMAKLHGTYESLQSGTLWDGLNYLTGFVSERIELKDEEDRDLLWGKLLSFQSCGFLMGTTINTSTQTETCMDEVGLVENHVYSVLNISSDNGHRSLQLRNPWGKFGWKGEASSSPKSDNSDVSPFKSMDGVFWISYQHFLQYFTSMEICKIRKDWESYTCFGILPPYSDKDCQSCFQIVCHTHCEVDISLYQNCKRNLKEKLKLTDIGLLIFETSKTSSGETQLKEVIELLPSVRKRCITCNLMLTPGTYCVIPFSFGHWTEDKENELFYGVTLSVYSSCKITCTAVRSTHLDTILSDALILCAKKYGKKRRYSLKDKYNDIYVITLNLGSSHCAVLCNHSSKHAELQMEYKTDDYKNTRGSLQTCDLLSPHHCQVIQVLTSKEGRCKMTFSHHLRIVNEVSLQKSSKTLSTPLINSRIAGLHLPQAVATKRESLK